MRLLPGIKILTAAQCELLGAPLTPEALPRALSTKIEAISRLVGRLPSLQSHTALFLLKNCLATPKLVYLLRCAPTWLEPVLLQELDACIRTGLEGLLNVSIDDEIWMQASLPVSRGGLGIRGCSKSLCSCLSGINGEHLGPSLYNFGEMAPSSRSRPIEGRGICVLVTVQRSERRAHVNPPASV